MDPVINIRLQFCALLPRLKSVLKLPVDRTLLQRLEQCVRRLLSTEQDPDVSTAVREAVLKLDKIEVVMETLSRRTMFEEDLVDQKKEEEEALMEERERSELSLVRHGSDGKKKHASKEDKNIKKASTVNSKKYGKQELRKSSSKEGKATTNKPFGSGSKVSSSPSSNSGLTKMSSMTSALPDLASCSYLSDNSDVNTSKKAKGAPSSVTVRTTPSGAAQKSNSNKKSPSTIGRQTVKSSRSQSTGKR